MGKHMGQRTDRAVGASEDAAPDLRDCASGAGGAAVVGEVIDFDIVLASASPRRRDILEQAGIPFTVCASNVDESLGPDDLAQPVEAAKKLAQRKAGAAVQEVLGVDYVGSLIVIGADTVVDCQGEIFGKPEDAEDAKRMLRRLSGRTHQVHTAVSVWMIHAPNVEDVSLGYRTFSDTTHVRFKDLAEHDIEDYLAQGESFDKAGAYAIQGQGAALVEGIEGYRSTVVGFPIERVLDEFPDIARMRRV